MSVAVASTSSTLADAAQQLANWVRSDPPTIGLIYAPSPRRPAGLERLCFPVKGRGLGYIVRSLLDDLGIEPGKAHAECDATGRIAISVVGDPTPRAWCAFGLTAEQLNAAFARLQEDLWRPGDSLL